jgi:Ca2+-binding EF-hand superfamily protein
VFMLITGRPPFPGENEVEVFKRILKCAPNYAHASWALVSPEAQRFVQNCLVVNPVLRYSAEKALGSPWLRPLGKTAAQSPASDEFQLRVAQSLRRFASYSALKRSALMIIAHQQDDTSQNLEVSHCFHVIDTVNQGFILPEELNAFLRHFDPAISESEVAHVFRAMDQDHTGVVRYMEFLTAAVEVRIKVTQQMCDHAFDHLDSERTGFITTKALAGLVGRAFSREEVRQMIRDVTKSDQNLRISREQFQQLMDSQSLTDNFLGKPPTPLRAAASAAAGAAGAAAAAAVAAAQASGAAFESEDDSAAFDSESEEPHLFLADAGSEDGSHDEAVQLPGMGLGASGFDFALATPAGNSDETFAQSQPKPHHDKCDASTPVGQPGQVLGPPEPPEPGLDPPFQASLTRTSHRHVVYSPSADGV